MDKLSLGSGIMGAAASVACLLTLIGITRIMQDRKRGSRAIH